METKQNQEEKNKVFFCYDIIHWHWLRLHIKLMTYEKAMKKVYRRQRHSARYELL